MSTEENIPKASAKAKVSPEFIAGEFAKITANGRHAAPPESFWVRNRGLISVTVGGALGALWVFNRYLQRRKEWPTIEREIQRDMMAGETKYFQTQPRKP